jgi:hypothetical protein
MIALHAHMIRIAFLRVAYHAHKKSLRTRRHNDVESKVSPEKYFRVIQICHGLIAIYQASSILYQAMPSPDIYKA